MRSLVLKVESSIAVNGSVDQPLSDNSTYFYARFSL
jgi:hypothetical protein